MTFTSAGRRELGPRPTPLTHDPMSGMSSARAGVYAELTRFTTPATVVDVADACAQHVNTVREHLDGLAEAGLVRTTRAAPGGRGRPALLYEALPPETSRPGVREYAGLASALARHIARTSPDPVADALDAGLTWAAELEARDPADSPATQDARGHLLDAFDRLGFDPHVDADGVVRLRTCPLLEAARRHTSVVCGVHLGLARGLAATRGGDPEAVSLLPFAVPGACLLHVDGDSGERGRFSPPGART